MVGAGPFDAHIQNEFLRDAYRLDIVQRRSTGEVDVLAVGDPTWITVGAGQSFPDGTGLLLPGMSRKPLARAFRDFVGDLSETEAEIRVLREWLTSERTRVDGVWNKA